MFLLLIKFLHFTCVFLFFTLGLKHAVVVYAVFFLQIIIQCNDLYFFCPFSLRCGNINWAKRTKCNICNTNKPGHNEGGVRYCI